MSPRTDFEAYGLSRGEARPDGRLLLLTVDFEAFATATTPAWSAAMITWAERAAELGLRFIFFVASENVVALKHESSARYEELLAAVHALHGAGAVFHPHNHYLFDPQTGLRPPRPPDPPLESRYRKRPSMYFDVVYRHRADLTDWLRQLTECHSEFLADAGVPAARTLAFRAGGWDCGSTREDAANFLSALAANGYSVDSSATAGEFATPTWRVESRFGENVFGLTAGLLEVAPTWELDCGAQLWSGSSVSSARALFRQGPAWRPRAGPGALVAVIHFDHLFRAAASSGTKIDLQVRSFLGRLSHLRRLLRVTSATFEDLDLRRSV